MIQAKPSALQAFFSASAEHTFFAELGFTNTKVVDYLAQLLTRFAHRDALFAVRSSSGQPLQRLEEMLSEAERTEHTPSKRWQMFRHSGDFALFWLGLFPEAIRRMSATPLATEVYTRQGKRCYYMASTYADNEEQATTAPVLRELSDHFEECVTGLTRVRADLHSGN